ncbi:MAG: hypothetical protein HWN67_14230 [Candidatus Helarchaeota archaeon]|nr:hypothetical protein [Candidatus Helarchaeota archaeon]
MVVHKEENKRKDVFILISTFYHYIKNNRFVVTPENLEELHEKIKILLDDEQLTSEMGEKSRELAQQYDFKIVGEKLINLYKEFL